MGSRRSSNRYLEIFFFPFYIEKLIDKIIFMIWAFFSDIHEVAIQVIII